MHVCMFEAPKHACMFEIATRVCMFDTCEHYVCLGCLSMYVCLQACLYGCMFETRNYHPGVGPDSLRKMFSIWTTIQFFEICEGGYFRSPQTYIQTLHYYGYEPTINILDPSVERVCSMYVCMYVCLKHPSMLVCLKSLNVHLVCMYACMYV